MRILPVLVLLVAAAPASAPHDGRWRAVLDLAGGSLPFHLDITASGGRICNGPSCTDLSGVVQRGDSVVLEIGDYAATIAIRLRGDSLVGTYRNVDNRGPRAIAGQAESRGSVPAVRQLGRDLHH